MAMLIRWKETQNLHKEAILESSVKVGMEFEGYIQESTKANNLYKITEEIDYFICIPLFDYLYNVTPVP